MSRVLREIERHRGEFHRWRDNFKLPQLDFDNTPHTSTIPPPLPYAPNKAFLEHVDRVAHLIQTLDGIDSFGHTQIQEDRKRLIMDIQEYQSYLDRVVGEQWEKKKIERNLLGGFGDRSEIDTSYYHDSRKLFSLYILKYNLA